MHDPINNTEFCRALGRAILALGVSAVLVTLVLLLLAPALNPELEPHVDSRGVEPDWISGSDFRPVVFGDGGVEGSTAIIRKLAAATPEEHAVLVHQRRFQSDHFPFLRYHIEGHNPALRVMLFWQRADTPGKNHFAVLNASGEGTRTHNLLGHEEWKGTITELAVGFFGDLRGAPVKFHGITLTPYGHRTLLQTVWSEWTAFALWDQRSINAYRSVTDTALVHPVPAVATWLGGALLILMLLQQVVYRDVRPGTGWLSLAIACGLCWAALDALWMQQLFRQNEETRFLFAGKTLHEKKLADWDSEHYRAVQPIKDAIANDSTGTQRIAILYAQDQAALAQRMRFHLLPTVRVEHARRLSEGYVKHAGRKYDYVVLLSAPGRDPRSEPMFRAAGDRERLKHWRVMSVQGPVVLYATNRAHSRGKS